MIYSNSFYWLIYFFFICLCHNCNWTQVMQYVLVTHASFLLTSMPSLLFNKSFIDRLEVHINTIVKKNKAYITSTYTHPHPQYYDNICQYYSKMNCNYFNTQNNYRYGCVSRISLHQAHIELNNGIVDVIIPFSDSIIRVLKLNTNFRINSLKDGMFSVTAKVVPG